MVLLFGKLCLGSTPYLLEMQVVDWNGGRAGIYYVISIYSHKTKL